MEVLELNGLLTVFLMCYLSKIENKVTPTSVKNDVTDNTNVCPTYIPYNDSINMLKKI